MIGTHRTVHPTEGYGIVIRFRRVDRNITFLSICDFSGIDIWGSLSSDQIQILRSEIPKN